MSNLTIEQQRRRTAAQHSIWFSKVAAIMESDIAREVLASSDFRFKNINGADMQTKLRAYLITPFSDVLEARNTELSLTKDRWLEVAAKLRKAVEIMQDNFNIGLKEETTNPVITEDNAEEFIFSLAEELVSDAWHDHYPLYSNYKFPGNYFTIISAVHAFAFFSYSLRVLKKPVGHDFYDTFLGRLSNAYITGSGYIHALLVITTNDIVSGQYSSFRIRKSHIDSYVVTDKTDTTDQDYIYFDVANKTITGESNNVFA